jgi:hypothetical protein
MTWGTRIWPTGGTRAAGGRFDRSAVMAASAVPPTNRNVSFGVSSLGNALRSVAAMIVAIGNGGVPVHVLGETDPILGRAITYWPGLTSIVSPPDVSVTEPTSPIFARPTCPRETAGGPNGPPDGRPFVDPADCSVSWRRAGIPSSIHTVKYASRAAIVADGVRTSNFDSAGD